MNPGARGHLSLSLSLWPRVPRRGQRAATVLCVAGHDEGRPCWLFLAEKSAAGRGTPRAVEGIVRREYAQSGVRKCDDVLRPRHDKSTAVCARNPPSQNRLRVNRMLQPSIQSMTSVIDDGRLISRVPGRCEPMWNATKSCVQG
jgi:hypothetical protein